MFKIPSEEDRNRVLEQYKVLKRTAVKDGKPYILSAEAGHAGTDNRSQGYTLAVKSTFASKADMDYYDDECEAHQTLKKITGAVREGPTLTVWFESATADVEMGSGVEGAKL